MSTMAVRGSRGMREDLSEITRSLARQLRAAADFLAPPPPPSSSLPPRPTLPSSSMPSSGAVGGGLRTGLAAISGLLGNSAEKEGIEEMGLSEEVLKFVAFLSSRHEEWVQCPVPLDDSFEMTEPRRNHIHAVERLVPSLKLLRMRLCPGQISEGAFWKIYLFLLHPKLSPLHSQLLSTSQIVEEMDRALLDLRNRIIRRLEVSRANATPTAVPDSYYQTGEIEEIDCSGTVAASSAARTTKIPGMTSWADSIEREGVEQWLEDVERSFESEDEPMLSDFESDLLIQGLRRPMSSSSVEIVQFSNACKPKMKPPRASTRSNRSDQKGDGESSDWIDAAGDSDSTLG